MKTGILYLLLSFFSITMIKAQEKQKDTLFFSIDKYYTISPTIIPNLSNQTYSERIELDKQRMIKTKTNGYVYFVGDGFLTKGLKPKKILSIKEYIENRQFYHDGKYNKIIDKWKLKDSLTDKYTLFFVNGDEFIRPRHLVYNSYYPIREGEKLISNKIKDTLFFNYDINYINTHIEIPNHYYLYDSSGINHGTFFFEEINVINNLNPKEILNLKNFIHTSRFYDESKKEKLKDDELAYFFSNYVVFLAKKDNKKTRYIEAQPRFAIE